ncbi:MAG: winged helix DNA-binding domain-containing protein [Rhodoglobus sp.]
MSLSGKRQLASLRLTALGLGKDAGFTKPGDVVRHLLAMQAQDFPGAKWSVGLRLPGWTDSEVEAALAAGQIVRSWPMRGTLHFVAPEDLHWMLTISRRRQAAFAAKRRADLGISDDELDRARQLAHDALVGGRVLRRDALLAVFDEAGIPTTAQRGYHLLWNLAQDGLIVFGPVDGKHHTFTLLDEWVANPRLLNGDEALGEFAARYFASHGPATDRDFAWWASLSLGEARVGIALAGLDTLVVDGITYYLRPGLEPARDSVLALPGFDEYMLGYQDRSIVVPAAFSERIVPGNNGVFRPTIVARTQVVGTWRGTEKRNEVSVATEPFTPLTTSTTAGFARAMKRYGAFVGKPVVVADA